jgi:hypothetical protein
MKPERRYNVYVIELDGAVLNDRRFRKANPGYTGRKPCVYVGMTARTPEERFDQHMRGYKSARLVRKHGLRLKPRLYASLNPMTHDEAKAMEIEKARRLRARGYAVWQR